MAHDFPETLAGKKIKAHNNADRYQLYVQKNSYTILFENIPWRISMSMSQLKYVHSSNSNFVSSFLPMCPCAF
jgi:hypothetical protein